MGLLCYLALARPRGLHPRDTLIALLWPEHDPLQGRRALRNALHGIRKQLGARAIVSTGDHLIGLDPAYLTCDAVELEDGGGATRAGELPGTEPLQGLHVDGAADFDRWMSLERDRLRALLARRASVSVAAVTTAGPTSPARRPYSPDAWLMHARGHYLFLRSAHGGAVADLERSREYFERAHALDPTFAPALAGLSNYYAVAARRGVCAPFHETFANAISLSERTLAMDATLAVPHVHFAVKALYLDDDWERAGTEFAMAVAKEPAYAEGHRFYGVWLGLARRHDEALREMEQAVALEPDIPHMTSSLAAARLAVGDRAGAEEALRRTLSLDPHHAPARERLVRLLEEDGRYDEAVAERARLRDPSAAEPFRTALERAGADGYLRVLHEAMRAEVSALEARILAGVPVTVEDIFSPPLVRLVSLYLRLGDRRRARSWRLQGIASRPALAHWLASLPEAR